MTQTWNRLRRTMSLGTNSERLWKPVHRIHLSVWHRHTTGLGGQYPLDQTLKDFKNQCIRRIHLSVWHRHRTGLGGQYPLDQTQTDFENQGIAQSDQALAKIYCVQMRQIYTNLVCCSTRHHPGGWKIRCQILVCWRQKKTPRHRVCIQGDLAVGLIKYTAINSLHWHTKHIQINLHWTWSVEDVEEDMESRTITCPPCRVSVGSGVPLTRLSLT